VPPQMYPGYKLNIAPAIIQLVEAAFGPRIAPLIFEDLKRQMAMEPEKENAMLEQGFELAVHQMDDDVKHMQAHAQAAMATGDPRKTFAAHMLRHQQSIEIKT